MKLLLTVFTAILLIAINSNAQNPDIDKYIDMINEGRADQVKSELLDLMAEYPGDPGVMLLHAMVLNDGTKSIKIFEKIIKDFPDSRWTETAYYKIIQYYILFGEIDLATIKLNSFKQEYPKSMMIGVTQDLLITADNFKGNKPSKQKVRIVQEEERLIEPQENDERETNLVALSLQDKEKPKDVEIVKDVLYNHENSLKVTEIKKDEPTVQEVPKTSSKSVSGTFGLQVGIFSNEDNATAEMRKFLKQRMRTEVKEKYVNNKLMYAVVIGNYSSRESAEAAKLIVKEQCECEPVVFEK